MGLTLGSDAPRIFRALVESTAFGAKMIVDRFVDEGVRIDGVIALGGVAKKSPLVMQIVSDVLDKPINRFYCLILPDYLIKCFLSVFFA